MKKKVSRNWLNRDMTIKDWLVLLLIVLFISSVIAHIKYPSVNLRVWVTLIYGPVILGMGLVCLLAPKSIVKKWWKGSWALYDYTKSDTSNRTFTLWRIAWGLLFIFLGIFLIFASLHILQIEEIFNLT